MPDSLSWFCRGDCVCRGRWRGPPCWGVVGDSVPRLPGHMCGARPPPSPPRHPADPPPPRQAARLAHVPKSVHMTGIPDWGLILGMARDGADPNQVPIPTRMGTWFNPNPSHQGLPWLVTGALWMGDSLAIGMGCCDRARNQSELWVGTETRGSNIALYKYTV